MNYVNTKGGRRHRLRALALLAVLVGACDADRLTTSDTPATLGSLVSDSAELAPDSAALAADSAALADSLGLSDSLSLDDSLAVTISASSTGRRGTPYGLSGLWSSYTEMYKGYQLFTASLNSDSPGGIVTRINAARRQNHQLVLAMTGGAHSRYTTRGRFDLGKWKRRMDGFRTPAIRAAVAAGVRDGTVLMNNMLDEPNNRDWGGVITKATLDHMASYVKGIFPTLPTGVSIRWDWRPNERYRVVDFIVTQYAARFGSVTAWRNQALAAAKKNGIALVFAFNPLNGGTRIRGCPVGRTGGKGVSSGNCRMTPSQIREAGLALGPSGCALLMWKYDRSLISKAANISAFKTVGTRLASSSRRSCRR
jgi:hypothetical protein